MCPDTKEDRLVANKKLYQRCLWEGERIDELARNGEKFSNQALPGLLEELHESELRLYLINTLPEKVSFYLKPKPSYVHVEIIPRGKEFLLTYTTAETLECVNQAQMDSHRG